MALTNQEFISWITSENSTKCILVEVSAYTGSADTLIYLSNKPYSTLVTDSPSNTSYLPVVTGGIDFAETLTLDGSPTINYGDITVFNSNGELDVWLDYVWAGRPINIFIGDVNFRRADFTKIFTGIVSDLQVQSNTSMSISLRDVLSRLNSPITEIILGSWGTKGALNQNKDQLRPLCFGEAHNITPLLVDDVLLEYMVHNGPIESIIEVRDNGVPVEFTPNLTNGTFRLTRPSFGDITCSVQGDKFTIDSTGLVVSGYNNNIARILQRIISSYGTAGEQVLVSEQDIASINAFSAANTNPVGIYINDRTNTLEVCQLLANSIGAQLSCNKYGLVRIARIVDPTPVATVNEITTMDILDETFILREKVPVQSTIKLGYCKNYTIQENLTTSIPQEHKDLFAKEWYSASVSNSAAKALYKQTGEPIQKDTQLITDTGNSTTLEATRLLNLYSTQRYIYTMKCTQKLVLEQPGDVVLLKYPRFGLAGGKKALILSSSINWNTGGVTLEVLV